VPADPPDSVPGDAKREVLDLRYVVEGTAAQVQDLKVRESDLEVQIELPADVLFDFDKHQLRPTAKESLDRAAEVIKAKSKGPIRITGYTDAKGNDNYNKKLSERRANAVRDYLVKEAGLRGKPFKTQGLGAANPVAPNAKPDGSDDPEGRQKNRRVEIVIRKKG
jgi:outer membrane protein OmpA-like peptidoglycan-associated protein